MRVIITLPVRLVEPVSARLAALPPLAAHILLHDIESALPLPEIQPGDGLLTLQSTDMEAAQRKAESASSAQVHYGEIALLETPFGKQHGFMIAAAGNAQDLHALSPVINALSPGPYAWWHVGHASAAAFLRVLLQQLELTTQRPIDISNPLPQLAQLATLQKQAGILSEEFLLRTEGERFIAALPDRQHALATFLDGTDSPARQIARMICLLAKTTPPDTSYSS